MPNEGDVELFSSLCSHNIYLMQFNSGGLLAALRILLSSSPSPALLLQLWRARSLQWSGQGLPESTPGEPCLEGGVSSNRRRTTLGFRPGAAELGGARVQATRLGTGRLPGTAWHLCGVRPRLPGSGTVPKPAHVLEHLQKIASVRARGPSSLPTCSCSDPRRHVQCQRVPRDATAPDRRACRHLDLSGFLVCLKPPL